MKVTELIQQLGVGISIGNSLDSALDSNSDETAWRNPPISRQLLKKVRNRGFQTLRLPVSWCGHIEKTAPYQIDTDWMNRVKNLVDWALELGFYVIVNVHHDDSCVHPNAWLSPEPASMERSLEMLCSVWKQVAKFFRDYDEHLLFEGFNEPHVKNDWIGKPPYFEQINRLGKAFAETVRSVSPDRPLIVPTYAASGHIEPVLALDPPENVIVSIHSYAPTEFCFPPHEVTWRKPMEHWGSQSDQEYIKKIFRLWKECFLDHGIPVILGETACVPKPGRANWAKAFFGEAKKNGIPCFWWDNGYPQGMGLFNRHTGEVTDEALWEAIINPL